ncbi:amino acid-binding protein [Vulcanisaeta sp. JCM 14467]|uniref:amino acid-binding protein n=1 Tax=Vulcanisaeta sp. JCM 14467 TaxID=1295370 RepID=UPI0006CF5021|nr:amino acid-binding protein [Vulcanisaeta sp. JCM 14467]
MPWLLIKVIRDRPGILNEITASLLNQGINIRNIIGNSHAIMLDIDDNVGSIHNLGTIKDIEVLGILNTPIIPLAFSWGQFLSALRTVLVQVGAREVERVLYRFGYEYAKSVVTEIPIGDPATTIKTYLYTATAYNRLVLRDLRISRDEIKVEFMAPFDEELNLAFTEGYIHGLLNTAYSRLHAITIIKQGNTYVATAKPLSLSILNHNNV